MASFAHPGGDVTGFASVEFSLGGKWLSVLKSIAPDVNRAMLLYSPDNPNWVGYRRSVAAGSAALSVEVTPSPVTTADEIERAYELFGRQPGGGVITVPSAFLGGHRERIAALAIRHRLPAIYPYRYFATSGGLVSSDRARRCLSSIASDRASWSKPAPRNCCSTAGAAARSACSRRASG